MPDVPQNMEELLDALERMPGGERQDLLISLAYKNPAWHATLCAKISERRRNRLPPDRASDPIYPVSLIEFLLVVFLFAVAFCLVSAFAHWLR